MTDDTDIAWGNLVRYFRGALPVVGRRLVVRRVSLGPYAEHGSAILSISEKTVTITVNRDSTDQVDALIHEWAHALCVKDGSGFGRNCHGREWGIQYSRVYTAWEKYDQLN